MYKEIVISIVIFILIVIGNFVTQNYTRSVVAETSSILTQLRNEISKEENQIDNVFVKEIINTINKNWDSKHEKLAYYIEHDELEKVDTNLTGLRSFIESKEYADALSELDKTVFVLKHIEEKNKFKLENIF